MLVFVLLALLLATAVAMILMIQKAEMGTDCISKIVLEGRKGTRGVVAILGREHAGEC